LGKGGGMTGSKTVSSFEGKNHHAMVTWLNNGRRVCLLPFIENEKWDFEEKKEPKTVPMSLLRIKKRRVN